MIPKIIWQTYECEYKNLPTHMHEWSKTWQIKNPGWSYVYYSAQEREDFVLKYFGKEWHSLYKACPINVMKADIWRFMILYIHGGFYVDIDTICKVSIESWMPEKSFIIADDGDDVFTNGAIASSKNNIIIKNVLDEIKSNLKSNKYDNKFFVYQTTGCGSMTRGILNALEIDHNLYKSKEYDKINKVEKAIEYGFHCFGKDEKIFEGVAFEQLYGSTYWDGPEYPSWQKEVEAFLRNKGI